MKVKDIVPEFSLLGGPLHRLGCRLGLVRGETNTVWLGAALGLFAWGLLVLLSLMQGTAHELFSLAVIGGHVRLLLVIPLFFLCETWVAPRMTDFAADIVHFGLVPESDLPVLASDIRHVGRLKDAWLAEILFLLAAFALPLLDTVVGTPGTTANLAALLDNTADKPRWVLGWYLAFCLPLFRFLMFRWLWRLGLWCYFLWRVQKLKLHLLPTHPDGAGGLGYLEIVHVHFAPLAVAISAVFSAGFAEDITAKTVAFETLYLVIPMVLLLVAALFVGPLFVFSRKLALCRITGWAEYMGMASRYVNAFDRRWLRDETASGESQLGTADIQSLADLTNSVDVVRGMRWIPAGQTLMMSLAASVIVPLLPLLLLKYPLDQVAIRLFQVLTGL
jgi:hypothetical protein